MGADSRGVASGPTQNYDDPALTVWRSRPVLAFAVRTALAVGPFVLALTVGLAAARWLPPARLGLPGWLWLVVVVTTTSAVLLVCSRWLRRLTPLSTLLRLSLVLPDRVPSRFSLARRRWSPAALSPPRDPLPQTGAGTADRGCAETLLGLLGDLAEHDARTRSHGERVQAYAALIGEELGLPPADVDKLSWAALLHDVGKVHVPVEIINKAGRPSDAEWAQLQQHPHHGGELVEPLRGWLGLWLDGVEQHHERWDGGGYPRGLAGEEISLAARVIAVADTYDVITSARAYKKPMTAEQARAEITRCAGDHFDPDVVRALLSVSIGRLRRIAGPATLLAALPLSVAAPAQAGPGAAVLPGTAALGQVAGGHVLAAVVAAAVGVTGAVTVSELVGAPVAAASPAGSEAPAEVVGRAAEPTGSVAAAGQAEPAAGASRPGAPETDAGGASEPAAPVGAGSGAGAQGLVSTGGPTTGPAAGATPAAAGSAPVTATGPAGSGRAASSWASSPGAPAAPPTAAPSAPTSAPSPWAAPGGAPGAAPTSSWQATSVPTTAPSTGAVAVPAPTAQVPSAGAPVTPSPAAPAPSPLTSRGATTVPPAPASTAAPVRAPSAAPSTGLPAGG
ncbi:MAG: HD-GYP domain-containing protein [Quadrisphaera sp.]